MRRLVILCTVLLTPSPNTKSLLINEKQLIGLILNSVIIMAYPNEDGRSGGNSFFRRDFLKNHGKLRLFSSFGFPWRIFLYNSEYALYCSNIPKQMVFEKNDLLGETEIFYQTVFTFDIYFKSLNFFFLISKSLYSTLIF